MIFAGLAAYATILLLVLALPILGVSSTIAYTVAVLWIIYGVSIDYQMRIGDQIVRHIPYMPHLPIVGSLPYISIKYLHLSVSSWAKRLGPVYRGISPGMPGGATVFASNYEAIRDVSEPIVILRANKHNIILN